MADSVLTTVNRIFRFENLEKPVQLHLKKVYSSLAICMLVAAVGGYVHLFTNILSGGLWTVIGSIAMLVMLGMTPASRDNEMKRFGFLTGFSFFTGLGLGPLMDLVIQINPSIIPTALLGTFVIFLCFTFSALINNTKQYLFLGGMLFSGLSWLMMLSLVNLFLGMQLLYSVNLYFGLLIMCGFVLYDTQLIVEKRRRGDEDYIWHSVELFIDFVNLFRRIMMILANNENRKKRRD